MKQRIFYLLLMIVSFLIAGCQAAPAAEEPPADETVLQYDPTNIIVSVSEPTALAAHPRNSATVIPILRR